MKALVLIASGTEDMEAVIAIDMLRRAGVSVTVAGDGNVVTCAHGIRIVPDMSIDELNEDDVFDAVVLPGGDQGVEALIRNSAVEQIVSRQAKRKGLIGAICAAPLILHAFGLLTKTSVITSYPAVEKELSGYAYTHDRVAEDGNIITSRGPGTSFEFALALIRRLTDATVASRVASDIVMYE